MDEKTNMQNAAQENEKAVTAWLAQNAIPVQTVEAGNGFADLQPLKQVLKDVKVVGLGGTTHGTREFFQMKHRLLEFLVTEMDFDTFAIEASYAACQPINEYVLYTKGDRAAVLTGQWYVVWDTEEFSELLDWMRAYNQGVPDEKKVKFQGLDITRNSIGMQAVLDYLVKVDPDRLSAAEALFQRLGSEETKWPGPSDEASKKTLVQLLPPLQELIDHLAANQDSFVRGSSLNEFDQALQYTRVMKQFILVNAADLLLPAQAKHTRSTGMAENFIQLAGKARSDAKLIIWAHNYHIRLADDPAIKTNMGSILRGKYGSAYFGFGFEFNQGAFYTRTATPEGLLADLKEVTLPPARADSLPWFLSRIHQPVFILNLRAPADNPMIEQWLETPRPIHNVNWAYNPAEGIS